MNASKTLRSILSIIDKDVKLIKKGMKNSRLEPEQALTLSRYASTLGGILEDHSKEKEKAKKKFEKLSSDELLKLFQEEQKGKNK